MVQQRSTVSVNDALRRTRCSGRIHVNRREKKRNDRSERFPSETLMMNNGWSNGTCSNCNSGSSSPGSARKASVVILKSMFLRGKSAKTVDSTNLLGISWRSIECSGTNGRTTTHFNVGRAAITPWNHGSETNVHRSSYQGRCRVIWLKNREFYDCKQPHCIRKWLSVRFDWNVPSHPERKRSDLDDLQNDRSTSYQNTEISGCRTENSA